MRNKVDPADSVKGRRREGTEGSQCKDKEANSGSRIQKCGSTKEKVDKAVEKKTNGSRDTRHSFNQIALIVRLSTAPLALGLSTFLPSSHPLIVIPSKSWI